MEEEKLSKKIIATSVAGFATLVGGASVTAQAETKTDKLDQSIETLKKAGIDVKTV